MGTASVDRSAPAGERMPHVMRRLKRRYPDAHVALEFTNAFQCVVATILSAQSTDARVNLVTKDLFRKYRGPQDFLAVPEEELQTDIQSTGFFRQKTRALRGMSQKLLEDFGGEVPATIAELITLPGVARKTANIVQANCYPEAMRKDPDAGIAVDTHVGRVAVRLALVDVGSKEAEKIERRLMELVPKKDWRKVTDLFITHGRQICDAKKPLCADCPIEPLCPSSQEADLPDLYRTAGKKPVPRGRVAKTAAKTSAKTAKRSANTAAKTSANTAAKTSAKKTRTKTAPKKSVKKTSTNTAAGRRLPEGKAKKQ